MTNFGSAFDLSSLNPQQGDELTVTGWLVKADQEVLKRYLQLSDKVPVLMLISDESQDSGNLRQLLTKVLESSEGRFAGIEVSFTTSPQLAQAVGVSMAPAMLAFLSGQPAPLFQGAIAQEQLLQVLSQVLQLASQNGITGRVKLGKGEAPKEEKPLSPEHEAAFSAIESGDLEGAKAQYQKIITEYPNDKEAAAGLAQVELMIRLQGAATDELGKQMLGADQLLASNNPEGAFALLLDLFSQRVEDREQIRERLLSLFALVGDSHPAVLEARRRLASLMF